MFNFNSFTILLLNTDHLVSICMHDEVRVYTYILSCDIDIYIRDVILFVIVEFHLIFLCYALYDFVGFLAKIR